MCIKAQGFAQVMMKVQQSCKSSYVHCHVFVFHLHPHLHLHSHLHLHPLPYTHHNLHPHTYTFYFLFHTGHIDPTRSPVSCAALIHCWEQLRLPQGTHKTNRDHTGKRIIQIPEAGLLANLCTACCSWYLESRLAQVEPFQVLAGWFMAWEPSAIPGSIHTLQQFSCSPSVQTCLTLTHELLKATFSPVSLYLKIQIGTQ